MHPDIQQKTREQIQTCTGKSVLIKSSFFII
jgi:hypothetical protein